MVPFGLGEPPQSLLLGQVVAFAHGHFSLPRALHHTECKSVGAGVLLSQRRGQRALPVNFAFTEFYEVREGSCKKYCIWGMRCPFLGGYGAIVTWPRRPPRKGVGQSYLRNRGGTCRGA